MCIAGYVDIDQSLSLFDGNRAWNHLVRRLSFDKSPLSEAPPALRESFLRWADQPSIQKSISLGSQEPVLLMPPEWGV